MTRIKQLQEDTHFRVLSMLEQNPELSQRDLAKVLGVSLGGVNYSLKALIERVARRKLLQLHAATVLQSLRVPPGNQLELLNGNREGQHSIRVNDQWRVCFIWKEDGAHQVEIVDYH